MLRVALLLAALLLTVTQSLGERALQARIVGGSVVTGRPYPWLASLQRTTTTNANGFKHFCGGTLIHPSWVLTAGHCVKYDDAPARVQLGQYDLDGPAESGARVATVSRVVRAPGNTDSAQTTNDVALLQLASPLHGVPLMAVNLGDDASLEATGSQLTVAGWGYLTQGASDVTDRLQAVSVPVFSQAICEQQYAASGIASNQLCAGYTDGKKDSCTGDSGGPLFHMDAAGQPMQVGSVSFGTGCAQAMMPGVYARLSSHAAWIASVIGEPLPTRSEAFLTSLTATGAPTSLAPTTAQPTTAQPTAKPTTAKPTAKPSAFPSLAPTRRPTLQPTAKPTAVAFSALNVAQCYIFTNNPGYEKAEQACQIPFYYKNWKGETFYYEYAPSIKEARPFGIDALPGISADDDVMRWCPTFGTTSYSVTSSGTRKAFGIVACARSQLLPTPSPTFAPSRSPSKRPTQKPTLAPTKFPTLAPSKRPTFAPSKAPSKRPTESPTKFPTAAPSASPTTREFFERDLFCRSFQRDVEGCSADDWHARGCQWRGGECRARLETRAPTRTPTLAPSASPSQSPAAGAAAGGEEGVMEKAGVVIYAAGGLGVVAVLVFAGAVIMVRRRRNDPAVAKRVKSIRSLYNNGGGGGGGTGKGFLRGKLAGAAAAARGGHGNAEEDGAGQPRRRAYSGWAAEGAQFAAASMTVFKRPMRFVSSRFQQFQQSSQQQPQQSQQPVAPIAPISAYLPALSSHRTPPGSPEGSLRGSQSSFRSFTRYESSSSGSHGTVSGIFVPPPPGFAAPAAAPVPPPMPGRQHLRNPAAAQRPGAPLPPPPAFRLPPMQQQQQQQQQQPQMPPAPPPPPGLGFSTRFSWQRR